MCYYGYTERLSSGKGGTKEPLCVTMEPQKEGEGERKGEKGIAENRNTSIQPLFIHYNGKT